MNSATWGDLEGGSGGDWAVEAPPESERLYEAVTDNEMLNASSETQLPTLCGAAPPQVLYPCRRFG